jgi:hypothetical protein
LSGLDQEYSDLVRELWGSPGGWNDRKSYADVARKLEVDEETVRNRLKRMKESGLLIGWRLFPNATLFGRSSIMQHMTFDSPTAEEGAISRLRRMEGAIVVASLYGADLLIALRRWRTLFIETTGCSGAQGRPSRMAWNGPASDCVQDDPPTDWQMAKS